MADSTPVSSRAQTPDAPLAPTYDPKAVEPGIAQQWEAAGVFHAEPSEEGKPYCIVIPPPNVTAALHLGHALNNTLQDVLIRAHRMMGFNTLWMPGTDHAGIATQTVVDKRLQAAGEPSLKDYKQRELDGEGPGGGGRDAFVGKVQAWKDEYEATITGQLKLMGCSCDWGRQRFTMDPQCAAAVREAFFQLFEDGLIYRGKRLVNWDPVSQTALADDEVEMRPVDGHFWYLKYPIMRLKPTAGAACGGGSPRGSGTTPEAAPPAGLNPDDFEPTGEYATVATTRPETMLGDTAVAVNPDDPPRAKHIGQFVKLPLVGRIIPIIGDDYVIKPDPESDDPMARLASGYLKVTPAHDPNDYAIGQRHDLPIINVMALDASISKDHGWPPEEKPGDNPELAPILGLSREDARRAVVRWFKKHDLLADQKPHRHSVGHSYRSHVPIEPYRSDQWYVKVTDDRLAGEALRALHPEQRQEPQTELGKQSFDSATAKETSEDDGSFLRFHPARYAKAYQSWHENIRDWCISRQLWWGHRIPVWGHDGVYDSGAQSGEVIDSLKKFESDGRVAIHWSIHTKTDEHLSEWPGESDRFVCVRRDDDTEVIDFLEAAGFTQDPDVLDTWFSSALWPMSTLGWPRDTDELRMWNPTSVLCTAREIITLWVSRMVMFNRYFMGRQVPFHDVFIHAMIQDGHGQKMSKSLGNGVDPIDIIHSHGADAMRFTLASMTTHTQDVKLPVDMVDPHTGESFQPETITSSQGYKVAAPIQERHGKKMVSSYGLASGEAVPTPPGGDMPLARNTSEKFDLGQRFANKMWNAVRFALGNLAPASGFDPSDFRLQTADFSLPDRWILDRLCETIDAANQALAEYEFARYATRLYDFFWRDLCDWYIEAVKPTVRERPAQRAVLAACLDASLRLLHPVMPFITEKLWTALGRTVPGDRSLPGLELEPGDGGEDQGLLASAAWPRAEVGVLKDAKARGQWELAQQVVGAIREVRATHKVPPRQAVDVSARAAPPLCQQLWDHRDYVATLANMEGGELGPHITPPPGAAAVRVGEVELFIHDVVDPAAERDRLTKRRDELAKQIKTMEGRLSNDKYVSNAPAHLVQETRDQLAEARREAEDVQQQREALGE